MSRRRIRFVVGLAAFLFLGVAPAHGQQGGAAAGESQQLSDAPASPRLTATLIDVARFESWSFFEPFPGGGDPTYTMFGNRARLGVSVESRHVDLDGAFQYAQLVGLPRRAVGPGPLGPGPVYFQSANATRAYQLYIKGMSLRVKSAGGLSFAAGRTAFASGLERDSGEASLEALKRSRLGERLAGRVEWTPFERAFDGARLDVGRSRWQATAGSFFPTQGVYEESANPTIGRVRIDLATVSVGTARAIAGAAAAAPSTGQPPRPASETQLFVYRYDDRRPIRSRPDNSGLSALRADIDVLTIGVSHAALYPVRGGRVDTIVWVARQTGDWYTVDHRAFSGVFEGGYRAEIAWQPWFRGGVSLASGDDDPRDRTHGTFFPMLPTTGPAVLAGTFAAMNLRDVFGEVSLQPSHDLRVTAAVHRLALADAADRWYSGSGATASRGTYFGFSARSSAGVTGLGTLLQASAEYPLASRWTLRGEIAIMRGGDVVQRQFAGRRLAVVAVESRIVLGK